MITGRARQVALVRTCGVFFEFFADGTDVEREGRTGKGRQRKTERRAVGLVDGGWDSTQNFVLESSWKTAGNVCAFVSAMTVTA